MTNFDPHRYTITIKRVTDGEDEHFEASVAELPDLFDFAESHEQVYALVLESITVLREAALEQGRLFPDPLPAMAEPVVTEPIPAGWIIFPKGKFRSNVAGCEGLAASGSAVEVPVYTHLPKQQAEPVVQDWDLLTETQGALRDAWAILKKLKAVQDAARSLIECGDSAADTGSEAFAAWCALVAAIDDADTLLCDSGESRAPAM